MIEIRSVLVAVVLIGGMVAFLPGSADAWPWDSVGGYGAAGQTSSIETYPAIENLSQSRMSTEAM